MLKTLPTPSAREVRAARLATEAERRALWIGILAAHASGEISTDERDRWAAALGYAVRFPVLAH